MKIIFWGFLRNTKKNSASGLETRQEDHYDASYQIFLFSYLGYYI